MSEEKPSIAQTFGFDRYEFSRAKIFVLVISGLMILLGAMGSFGSKSAATDDELAKKEGATESQTAPDGSRLLNSFGEPNSSLPPSDPPDPGAGGVSESDLGIQEFSPLLVKGGFGMFLGFAIGFAIRTILRLVFVLIGLLFFCLTVLAYLG